MRVFNWLLNPIEIETNREKLDISKYFASEIKRIGKFL